MNLLVPVILGWMAICRGDPKQKTDESEKSIITEYRNGNLEERLTVDHSSYQSPTPAEYHQHHPEDIQEEQPNRKSKTKNKPLKKISIPVYEDEDDKFRGNEEYKAPVPTIPQDFLNEINEMKIPEDGLPKSINNYRDYLENSFPETLRESMKDDIEEPDFRKYFNKDYHVPKEYNRFKFNFKGHHQENDKDYEEETTEHVPDEEEEQNVKENANDGKDIDDGITDNPPFRVITETKVKYDKHNDAAIKFPNENSQMYNRPCLENCLNTMYKMPYVQHKYPNFPYYPTPSGLIRPVSVYRRYRYPSFPVYHYHFHPKIKFRPKVYSYPIRRPHPYIHYYRRLPYINPGRKHPKFYPLFKPVDQTYNHKPINERLKNHDCPPSKIIKEVHVHHYPKGKTSEINKLKLDEANHEENYDHESIVHDEENEPHDEMSDEKHEELIELSQHLDNALFKNKQELIRKLKEGQRYPIYDEDYPNSFSDYTYEQDDSPREVKRFSQKNDDIVVKRTPIRMHRINSYRYNYTLPKDDFYKYF